MNSGTNYTPRYDSVIIVFTLNETLVLLKFFNFF